jgi:hypothetical protein
MAQAGVNNIRANSQRQSRRPIERAPETGYRIHSPERDGRRGGVVVLDGQSDLHTA